MRATTKPSARARERDLAAALVLDTQWSESAYLGLQDLNRPIEFSDGKLLLQDMPTPDHQRIVRRIFQLLERAVCRSGGEGEVWFAPLPVRLWPGKFREPDVFAYLHSARARLTQRYAEVPDLVAEVLSEGTERVDRGEKFVEYAQAGVREYWVVDPEARAIQVFALKAERFVEAGHYVVGQELRSDLLPGLHVPLGEVFG